MLEAIAALCASCGEPLAADCLVNYRRFAWQDETGTLRVTLDQELAFFRPPADLWTRDWALVRATLGTAVAKEKRMVLEVKTRAEPPAWLPAKATPQAAVAQTRLIATAARRATDTF